MAAISAWHSTALLAACLKHLTLFRISGKQRMAHMLLRIRAWRRAPLALLCLDIGRWRDDLNALPAARALGGKAGKRRGEELAEANIGIEAIWRKRGRKKMKRTRKIIKASE
jgi:hypothetical protein